MIGALQTLWSFLFGRKKLDGFVCADCSIWRSCDRSPDRPCIEREMQIEEYGDRPSAIRQRAIH